MSPTSYQLLHPAILFFRFEPTSAFGGYEPNELLPKVRVSPRDVGANLLE